MEKTLIRWHINWAAPDIGWQILAESVGQIQKLYPEFDCIICTNGTEENFSKRSNLLSRVQHVEQDSKDVPKIPFKFSAEDWKLCPPRMRLNAHEIIIDNDLIITERLPSLDAFLGSNKPMCLEAGAVHKWVRKAYGQFEAKIPKDVV